MIDKKQRIELRSLASTIKPSVYVGKDGFSENVLKEIDSSLLAHELIKISMQEDAPTPTKDELTGIAVKLGADVVTTIGRKIVLYRYSAKKGIKHILKNN